MALEKAGHVRLRGSGQRDSHCQGAAFGGRCGYLRGARMARLRGPAIRRRLPLLKGPLRVPDPGQHVELRMEDGSWRRGFRAVSQPSTTEWGEVVVWVATEDEYRAARGEGRSAVGVPWPAERMVVSSSAPLGNCPTLRTHGPLREQGVGRGQGNARQTPTRITRPSSCGSS